MVFKSVGGAELAVMLPQMTRRIAILSCLLVVVFQAHLIDAEKPRCGPGLRNPCPDPVLCCNWKGKCGSRDVDCGDGCQSGPCLYDRFSSGISGSKVAEPDQMKDKPTQCGPDLKNPCPDANSCCNYKGKCGFSASDCGAGCQSGNCFFGFKAAQSEQSAEAFLTKGPFEKFFPKRNAFFKYIALRSAVRAFPEFGTTGSPAAQKREVAAFLAHVHHETAGLAQVAELDSSSSTKTFCAEETSSATLWTCLPGKKYFARGPLKLTWNYNYGKASAALGVDLLAEPEQLTENAELAFKSALWVWMSSKDEKTPSAHEAITGSWSPSAEDVAAHRLPGFGTTIAVLAGRAECGHESDAATDRVEKYLQAARMLDVDAGSELDCASMLPF